MNFDIFRYIFHSTKLSCPPQNTFTFTLVIHQGVVLKLYTAHCSFRNRIWIFLYVCPCVSCLTQNVLSFLLMPSRPLINYKIWVIRLNLMQKVAVDFFKGTVHQNENYTMIYSPCDQCFVLLFPLCFCIWHFPAIPSTWLHRYYLNWTELEDDITKFNNEMPLTENSVC